MARRGAVPAGAPATVGRVAKALGVSMTAVKNARRRGMPHDIDGARKWREQQQQTTAGTLAQAQRRKLEAEAELKELELAHKRGNLVTLDEAEAEFQKILAQLRATLVASPGKFAPRLVGLRTMAEAMSALESIVHEVMDQLVSVADDVGVTPDRA